MAIKHTPGPWRVTSPLIIASYQGFIATVISPDIVGTDKALLAEHVGRALLAERVGNARLIAAAPELLAFVEMVAAGNTEFERLEEIARQMLAELEGKP